MAHTEALKERIGFRVLYGCKPLGSHATICVVINGQILSNCLAAFMMHGLHGAEPLIVIWHSSQDK